MIAFEIHTLKNGNWTMDSVFDDRNLALHEAKKANDSNRYSGIRLIEETYEEASGLTTTRVIFRGGSVVKPAQERRAATSSKSGHARPKRQPGKAPVRKTKAPEQTKKQQSILMPAVLVLFLLAAGLGALATLYQMAPVS